MIGFTARAARHIRDLREHFESLERYEALAGLMMALSEAAEMIEITPMSGQEFPRPYPQLARRGRLWIKIGRYWIGYQVRHPPIIVAVFYDQANIPGRLS